MTQSETYPEVTCKLCGKTQRAAYVEERKKKMVERQLCFSCLFWSEHAEREDRSLCPVINGHHYSICPEIGNKRFSGFGGERFLIRFNDGREVITSNLWHQGEIPAHFRQVMPDNAVRLPAPR